MISTTRRGLSTFLPSCQGLVGNCRELNLQYYWGCCIGNVLWASHGMCDLTWKFHLLFFFSFQLNWWRVISQELCQNVVRPKPDQPDHQAAHANELHQNFEPHFWFHVGQMRLACNVAKNSPLTFMQTFRGLLWLLVQMPFAWTNTFLFLHLHAK